MDTFTSLSRACPGAEGSLAHGRDTMGMPFSVGFVLCSMAVPQNWGALCCCLCPVYPKYSPEVAGALPSPPAPGNHKAVRAAPGLIQLLHPCASLQRACSDLLPLLPLVKFSSRPWVCTSFTTHFIAGTSCAVAAAGCGRQRLAPATPPLPATLLQTQPWEGLMWSVISSAFVPYLQSWDGA